MKIYLVKPRGFCGGVIRAIDTVNKALKIWGAPLYVKHEIVHNKHVINELKQKGVVFIEDLQQVPEGARLVYSAHGVSPQVRKEAEKRNLITIDATCPLVGKIHQAILSYAEKGYKIILIGKKNHVEVTAARDEAYDQTMIISNEEEARNLQLPKEQKLFYVTQTTFSLDDCKKIVDILKEKYPHIETLTSTSICYATQNRQNALKEIAKSVEFIYVVGDPKSSNSNRLWEIAKNFGVLSKMINDPEEIQEEDIENCQSMAITAGASTPEYVVEACLEKIGKITSIVIEEKVFFEEKVSFPLPKELKVLSQA
jgi:4-hydroxy-3-methylbut-2-enyl diphosphate reductase